MSEPVKPHFYPDPAAQKTLDIKRLYLPFVLRGACPQCGSKSQRDFNTDSGGYLSYPRLNAPFRVDLWCEPCNRAWEVLIQLDFDLRVVEPGAR